MLLLAFHRNTLYCRTLYCSNRTVLPGPQGVVFEQKHVEVSEAFRKQYDTAADAWTATLAALQGMREHPTYGEKVVSGKSGMTSLFS